MRQMMTARSTQTSSSLCPTWNTIFTMYRVRAGLGTIFGITTRIRAPACGMCSQPTLACMASLIWESRGRASTLRLHGRGPCSSCVVLVALKRWFVGTSANVYKIQGRWCATLMPFLGSPRFGREDTLWSIYRAHPPVTLLRVN